jgi:spore germination cell wall hydrolase CwlJ-like protein
MRVTRLVWALTSVCPWCIACLVVVSLTAQAGQEISIGVTRVSGLEVRAPEDLVPVTRAREDEAFPISGGAFQGLVSPASLTVGQPEDLASVPDETEPKLALKRHAAAFPTVDRSNKGNALFGLRPSFETRLDRPSGLRRTRRFEILFAARKGDPKPALFSATDLSEGIGPEAVENFEGAASAETTTTAPAEGLASPQSAAAALTTQASSAASVLRLAEGSTPNVPRAVRLSSTTPQAGDAAPVEVDAMLRLPGAQAKPGASNLTIVARNGSLFEQPDYKALISSDNFKREQQCLAEAIYFEARSEPEAGQAAVAQVVLNRVASGLFPNTVCGVVYQNAEHYLGCQFSFACEGKALHITEPGPWAVAQRIAQDVTDGSTYMQGVGDAMNYHAKYVTPYWAHTLTKVDVIGQHIFYRLKPPGQS